MSAAVTCTVACVAETIVVAPRVSPVPETESEPPARKPAPLTVSVWTSSCLMLEG